MLALETQLLCYEEAQTSPFKKMNKEEPDLQLCCGMNLSPEMSVTPSL
jgi:hypothetical protein